MKTRVLLAVIAGTFGFAVATQAATISSPAIFGSHGQNQATCVLLNASTETRQITLTILTESGTAAATNTQTVAPGQFLVTFATISSGVAYACSATAGNVGGFSAALTIIDIVPDGFGSTNHRPIRSSPLR